MVNTKAGSMFLTIHGQWPAERSRSPLREPLREQVLRPKKELRDQHLVHDILKQRLLHAEGGTMHEYKHFYIKLNKYIIMINIDVYIYIYIETDVYIYIYIYIP